LIFLWEQGQWQKIDYRRLQFSDIVMAFGHLLRSVVTIRVESKNCADDSYGKERERREKDTHKRRMKSWQSIFKSKRSSWEKRNSKFYKTENDVTRLGGSKSH